MAWACTPVLLGACAAQPVSPPTLYPATADGPRIVHAIEIDGLASDPSLQAALDGFVGKPASAPLRDELAATVLAYYEWLEWREIEVQAAPDTDAQGVLRVLASAQPPEDLDPPPQAWFDIPMPGPTASPVAAPAPAGGARPEPALDDSFSPWLESPALALIVAADRRLYIKREDGVVSYPVAVGTPRTPTPPGDYWVEAITHKPTWYPPPSIRRAHAAKGTPLPLSVPPGRGNPLGSYFVRLQNSIGIHGTNQPRSIGRAASHGCVRMHDRDVRELVTLLKPGDGIRVVRALSSLTGGGQSATGVLGP